MADEFKTNKTPQVMHLVTGSPTEINPFLQGTAKHKSKDEQAPDIEETIEDKLKNYTQQKRGKSPVKAKTKGKSDKAIQNPILKIPAEQEKQADAAPHKITLDVNRVILEEELPAALERFKCCDCDQCIAEITKRVLETTPTNFLRILDVDSEKTLANLRPDTSPIILKALVKVLMENKRKPFHNR